MRITSLVVVLLVPLAGCATVMEGGGQSMTVSTNPPGALCNVDRAGGHLGTVANTPGSLRMDKSKNDITVSCTKDGYQPASITQSPKFVGTTFGNILIGGLVGVVVDAASGANFAYPAEVRLEFAPLTPASADILAPVSPPASVQVPSGVPVAEAKRSPM